MNFLNDFIEKDPIGNTTFLIIFVTLFFIMIISFAFFFDYSKNNKNFKTIQTLERAIKDLIEEFRSLELNFSEQKKILQDYKYTLEKLDLEVSRLADANKGDT